MPRWDFPLVVDTYPFLRIKLVAAERALTPTSTRQPQKSTPNYQRTMPHLDFSLTALEPYFLLSLATVDIIAQIAFGCKGGGKSFLVLFENRLDVILSLEEIIYRLVGKHRIPYAKAVSISYLLIYIKYIIGT